MSYRVAIHKNETGEVRIRQMPENVPWGEHSEFWWTEGNMGCDCNLELEFERAGGAHPGLDDVECGSGRFSALYAQLQDGTRVTLDDE